MKRPYTKDVNLANAQLRAASKLQTTCRKLQRVTTSVERLHKAQVSGRIHVKKVSKTKVTTLSKRESEERIPWQDDPDPTMPSMNPFTQARNLALKKQSEVAELLGVQNTDIIRLEQGILTYVPQKYIEFYKNELGMPDMWEAGYRQFQRLLRQSAPRPLHGIWQTPPGEFTFRRWRLHNWPTLSQIGWCKAFCIHPGALYSIEKDAADSVSGDILMALIEANIMSDEQARNFAGQIRATLRRRKIASGKAVKK